MYALLDNTTVFHWLKNNAEYKYLLVIGFVNSTGKVLSHGDEPREKSF